MKVANIEKAGFVIERYQCVCSAIETIEESDKESGFTEQEAADRYDNVKINSVYSINVWVKHSVIKDLLIKLHEQYKKEVEAL